MIPGVSAETSPWLKQSDVASVSGDSETKAASQNFATKVQSGLENKIAGFDTTGDSCAVAYTTPIGKLNMQTIVDFNHFVYEPGDPNDVSDAIFLKDFQTLYTKAGTFNGRWYGYDPDYAGGDTPGYTHWELEGFLDATLREIRQLSAASDYTFILSPMAVDRFDVIARLSSSAMTDGCIGMVAAFAEDTDGKPHTLSFLRMPPPSEIGWMCVVDFDGIDELEDHILALVPVGDPNPQTWGQYPGGVRTEVTRNGDSISANTAIMGGSALSAAQLVVDLANLSCSGEHGINYDQLINILPVFRGKSKIGFSSYQQAGSTFSIEKFSVPVI